MKSEILAMGGQASVFAADPIDADAETEIVSTFRAARDGDYKSLLADFAALERRTRIGSRIGARGQAAAVRRTVRAYRDRLAEIVAIDFFVTPARRDAEAALAGLEGRLLGAGPTAGRAHVQPVLSPGDYRGRAWVTRPKPGVDRMACAWLIRAFIDPQAVFVFSEKPSGQQVPFDMYESEFSHHGGLCTFEVLEQRFRISDLAVRRIGEIVHDLDVKDARFQPPEAATLGALIEGLRATHDDDDVALQAGMDLFQALHRSMTAATPADATAATRRQHRAKAPTARRKVVK
jgi:hypothetical protein